MSVITPTVIRLSQYEADTVNQNGDYVVTLAQPVTINAGDRIVPYQCLIDTQRPDDETIVIPQDISVSIAYMYYEQNTNFTDKTTVNATAAADNEIYIMYHSDPSGKAVNRVLRQQEINVPAGSYTPNGLAEYLTDTFSNTTSGVNLTSLSTGNNLLIATDTGSGGGAVTSLAEFSWGDTPEDYGTCPNVDGDATAWGASNREGGLYYLSTGEAQYDGYPSEDYDGGAWVSMKAGAGDIINDDHDSDFHIVSTGTNGTGSGLTIRILPQSIDDELGGWFGPNIASSNVRGKLFVDIVDGGTGYNRGDEVYFDHTLFGAVNDYASTFYRLGSSSYPVTGTARLKLIVESIATGTSYYEFMKLGGDPKAPANSYRYADGTAYWIGATEFDLEFNQDSNGLFSFNFLHTPFYKVIKDQPLQPAVLIKRQTTPIRNSIINVDCGILITNLSPKSFWQDILNFDIDSIILRDASGTPVNGNTNLRTIINSIDNCRTTGYLGLNGFLNDTDATNVRKILNPPQDDLPVASTLTNPINSSEFKTNSGSGYFLVEIDGAYKQELITGDNRKLQCSAIVSRQYNSNEMVTAYEESAIPYVHQGNSLTFSQLHIRILEPDTSPPNVADDLGENNSIFIRIDRGENSIPVTQEQQMAMLKNKKK